MILEICTEINSIKNILENKNIKSFMISNNCVYTDIDSIETAANVFEDGLISIKKITSKNLNVILNSNAKQWCKEKIFQQELLEYENTEECQYKLMRIEKALDEIENLGKEVDNNNGKTKPRTRKKSTTKENS